MEYHKDTEFIDFQEAIAMPDGGGKVSSMVREKNGLLMEIS